MSNLPAGTFQQRDSVLALAPPWLKGHGSNAERFLYTLGLALDVLLEKQNQAQKIHMPGQGDDTAIPYLAEDRLLVQGLAETNAAFILRLQKAFDSWSRAGSARSVLEQLQAFLVGTQPGVAATMPEAAIVGGNLSLTTWDILNFNTSTGAPPTHILKNPANWGWDGKQRPWRSWLVLYMAQVPTGQSGASASVSSTGGSGVAGVTAGFSTITGLSGMSSSNIQQYLTISGAGATANNGSFQIVAAPSASSVIIANPGGSAPDINNGSLAWSVGFYPFIGPCPVWGSPQFIWGTGQTWGVNCSPLLIQSIRQILQRWKQAGAYYPHIIISFGGGDGTAPNDFSPNSVPGNGNPDSTWGNYGKLVNGVWVPAKTPHNLATAFCDGTGSYVLCTEQNIS